MRKVPEDLVEFVESGVSILVGTRSTDLRPDATAGCGAVVLRDRQHLSVLLAPRWSERALANVAATGVIAVAFSRMLDHHTIQLKGEGAVVREGTEADRLVFERYSAAYIEQLYLGGLPRSLTGRFHGWPANVVTFQVEDIFVQTPGPGAGNRFESK